MMTEREGRVHGVNLQHLEVRLQAGKRLGTKKPGTKTRTERITETLTKELLRGLGNRLEMREGVATEQG